MSDLKINGDVKIMNQILQPKIIKNSNSTRLIGYISSSKSRTEMKLSYYQALISFQRCISNYNCTGSVLTYDEQVELDAIIMDGHTLKVGAVAAIKNVRNPVKVARLVMDKTQHVLLAGCGANKFAANHGHNEVDPDTLITPYAREELAEYKKYSHAVNSLFNKTDTPASISDTSGHDTVGCAVLDNNGQLACATSTGGITAKMPGRVGDSPIVGAGGYADNTVGAVSTTGHGESIIKVCLARHITFLMGTGCNSKDAVSQSLSYMESRVNGFGGAVVVSKSGDVAAQFSTPRMPWAFIKSDKLHFGMHHGQHEIENL
ncbi:unnamed protein product, partial [Meganyctiphanes norvegica]